MVDEIPNCSNMVVDLFEQKRDPIHDFTLLNESMNYLTNQPIISILT